MRTNTTPLLLVGKTSGFTVVILLCYEGHLISKRTDFQNMPKSAENYKNQLKYSSILMIPPNFVKFSRSQQDSERFNKILQDSARFCEIQRAGNSDAKVM